jgi:hypothetical protein
MSLLSAALIVRDEERNLLACLTSLRNIAGEIVVVDTGSRDHTRDIAQAAGARVFEFLWQDDFGAARNEALGHCSGDWILYIDADERVRPGTGDDLKPALDDERAVAHQVRFFVRPGFTPYWELRLFRNHPGIRFEGIIHENIWPAVLRFIDNAGGHVGRVALCIDHFGYERDQERKYARDLPLLFQRVRTDPDSVYCWQQIGHIHRMQGDIAAARAALGSGIEVVRAKSSLVHQDSLPFVELAAIALETGDPPPGPLLSEARELFPEQFHLAWLQGRLWLEEQRLSAAAERFTALAAREDDNLTDHALGYDVRLFGAWPLAGLASCRFAEARYAEAAALFAAAARRDPEQLEYRVKQALAARLAGAASVT